MSTMGVTHRSWDRPGPRLALVLGVTLGCVALYAADVDSPVRVVLALGFALFAPGLAIAELLELPGWVPRVALATAASLAIETLVVVALLYAGAWSVGAALGIVAALTVAAAATAWLRRARAEAGGNGPR